ncbi:TPA: hypothetical protein ACKP12_005013, partial [Serratia marcescens]
SSVILKPGTVHLYHQPVAGKQMIQTGGQSGSGRCLMDKRLQNGHRVELKDESMRKLAQTDQTS